VAEAMPKTKKEEDLAKTTVEIPVELKRRLDAYAEKEGVKIRHIIRKALEDYLNRVGA
jgi:predicted transcriptional regulator